jgi:hypothetical protein
MPRLPKKTSLLPRSKKGMLAFQPALGSVLYSPFLGQLNTPEEIKDTAILLKGWCNY